MNHPALQSALANLQSGESRQIRVRRPSSRDPNYMNRPLTEAAGAQYISKGENVETRLYTQEVVP